MVAGEAQASGFGRGAPGTFEPAPELLARADLVVSHGQTVFHWVEENRALGTLQLGQPAWISARTGSPVVSDLRSRDIAAGGQGAPLASLLDVLLLGESPKTRAALNLGGIANVTVVSEERPPLAYDTGQRARRRGGPILLRRCRVLRP